MQPTSTRARSTGPLGSISLSIGRLRGRSAIRLAQWEKRTESLLSALAVVFLAGYAWPILDPGMPGGWHRACGVVDSIVWIVFGVDYVVRVTLAPARRSYMLRHLPDLVILALPFLRPLRLLMLIKILNRRVAQGAHGRIAIIAASSSILLIFCAALAALNAERHAAGASIVTFGDALWWAISTVCTVGYGDMVPVTAEGRVIAVFLMLGGIAVVGLVTATFASWLISKIRSQEKESSTATKQDLDAVLRELRVANARIDDLRRAVERSSITSLETAAR